MSFFGLGIFEIAIIGVLALIFIGPEKLPGVIRDLMGYYRQIRSLGTEWREQVEREIGGDLRSLTQDVNQGLEAFGRSIEKEIEQVDAEIKDAQAVAMEQPKPANPPEFPTLPTAQAKTADDDDDDRPKSIDYLPS
jgi:sec-independent protein translocase protein TatB